MTSFGTGALKVTPAHDENDFNLGLKHNLEFIDILTPEGKLNENAKFYIGEDRFIARKKIVKDLAFDVNKDYKRVFIKHTFEINDLEIPKEYLNDFVKARLYAIRKGKLIRQVNIDGEQVKKEYILEV